MKQVYFDDGVEGYMEARLQDGVMTVETQGMDVEEIKAYVPQELTQARVNGETWTLRKEANTYLICPQRHK